MRLNFGPWRRINDLEKQVDQLTTHIEFLRSAHADVKQQLEDNRFSHSEALKIADNAKNDLRRMAMIMALRGFDKVV